MRIDSVETDSTYDWRRDGWLAACALTAVLLIVSAATTHAPGFDTFLRLFVFCMALVRGLAGFRRGGAWLPLSAGLIAILFNPVRPVVTSAAASAWLDLIAAVWFALVGAWRLLGSWEPQRGWAAAALSLCALAVPAVAAFSAPNRDALNPLTVNENLAEMNAAANAATAAPAANAATAAPDANAAAANVAVPSANSMPVKEASATDSARSQSHTVTNTAASEGVNRVKPVEREVSAKTAVKPKPPPTDTQAASPANQPADIQPINNESEGNQEL